jgi:hypothetical protein
MKTPNKGNETMSEKSNNGLKKLEVLIGKWSGHGAGFGHTSDVEHEFEFVLQGKFIRSVTHSVAHDDAGEVVEVHEDLGMFSYDPDRETIILREFYTEGYVITYVMKEGDKPGEGFVFTSEETEGTGGLQAQLRLDMLSQDEYQMFLDLANPGEDWRECQALRMRRNSS